MTISQNSKGKSTFFLSFFERFFGHPLAAAGDGRSKMRDGGLWLKINMLRGKTGGVNWKVKVGKVKPPMNRDRHDAAD
jgi:hypothetical protein